MENTRCLLWNHSNNSEKQLSKAESFLKIWNEQGRVIDIWKDYLKKKIEKYYKNDLTSCVPVARFWFDFKQTLNDVKAKIDSTKWIK